MKKSFFLLLTVFLVLSFCGSALAQVSQVSAQSNGYTWVNGSAKFTFSGSVYSERAGQIQYRWLRSDNANPPVHTLNASGPGWYPVEPASWALGTKWSGQTFSITLEVIHPNNISSAPVNFTVP